MRERARSVADKTQRSEELLEAAEALALELGGVRFVTVAAVTERAGLHRTGVRRYYASREELLLELAERGWGRWREAVVAMLENRARTGEPGGSPREPAELSAGDVVAVIVDTISPLSVFCDLLAHVPMSLEGDVDIERARRYKTNSFAAYDEIVAALDRASGMTAEQIQHLMAAAVAFVASFWQVSHPTPVLAELYRQELSWGHVALDFAPRLRLLLQATAIGLSAASHPAAL